jgi:hypothetical protein
MALGCALALMPARKREVLKGTVAGELINDSPPALVEARS